MRAERSNLKGFQFHRELIAGHAVVLHFLNIYAMLYTLKVSDILNFKILIKSNLSPSFVKRGEGRLLKNKFNRYFR
ncbi:MAG: hypothetical protein COY75_02955 [Nitrospirae bacterium CG_4_10_14_0_8_um_filter_41_23]|nr:MAG: hypothetical protein COY75_02955 [Nitrospirae bacterium CG_4_10_14_0_8_um_filter_41_23]